MFFYDQEGQTIHYERLNSFTLFERKSSFLYADDTGVFNFKELTVMCIKLTNFSSLCTGNESLAYSEDSDEMAHYMSFYQDLQYLQR